MTFIKLPLISLFYVYLRSDNYSTNEYTDVDDDAQHDGCVLYGSKFQSYFSPFLNQSSPS